MKLGLIIIALFIVIGTADAGDISCQVDIMKPKIKAAVIDAEILTPASEPATKNKMDSVAKTQPEDNQTLTEETTKKESRLGGLFEILLPSKLRNPVRKL